MKDIELKERKKPIQSVPDAIKAARRLLAEAEAYWMLREYRPSESGAEADEQLAGNLRLCLTLSRVCVAMALDIEAGTFEGGE
jgi:hypothetical protein